MDYVHIHELSGNIYYNTMLYVINIFIILNPQKIKINNGAGAVFIGITTCNAYSTANIWMQQILLKKNNKILNVISYDVVHMNL